MSNTIPNIDLSYNLDAKFLDEVYAADKKPRAEYQDCVNYFSDFSKEDYKMMNESTKLSFFNQGVTFAVYSDSAQGKERIFPFDLFPRIITNNEWINLEKGIKQRNKAINLFLFDLYHDQKILKDKIVPKEMILSSANFNKHMIGVKPKGGIYVHISGIDIIKHSDNQFYILEDNLRCPSGVSYVLTNRIAMKRTLSNLFKNTSVSQVEDYPQELLKTMQSVSPQKTENINCVLLTPGMYNSAYFEHTFLAMNMGIPLVEGRDMFVEKNFVYMKTIYGPKRVDVIYRRIDDDFIDPIYYRPDSMLGVPGLMKAYIKGNVTLVNAPGTGVADDKAVYTYMPEIIKYYLGEDAILRNVDTFRCEFDNEYKHVLDNLDKLVIKPVDESGGYGIVIGPKASKAELEDVKQKIMANRRKYIAQPVMNLSTHSTFIDETSAFEGRHIDLRVYSLTGKDKSFVLKGGLTRVALKRGSLIVNSSQGGGSKDTWVMDK